MQFLQANELGSPSVNQCEVTHVNHIVAGVGWTELSQVGKIIRFWGGTNWQADSLEDCCILVRYVIPDSSGEPAGRLFVELRPALRAKDKQPMYILRLTARGFLGEGLDFLDVGREWIVRAFESLTTKAMHQVWKSRAADGVTE